MLFCYFISLQMWFMYTAILSKFLLKFQLFARLYLSYDRKAINKIIRHHKMYYYVIGLPLAFYYYVIGLHLVFYYYVIGLHLVFYYYVIGLHLFFYYYVIGLHLVFYYYVIGLHLFFYARLIKTNCNIMKTWCNKATITNI